MDLEEQYDKIFRYCYFKIYDKQLSQDITQETFLRFYSRGLALDGNSKLPYLYTIARNLCVDEFRKKPAACLDDIGDNIGEEAACDTSAEWIDRLALRTAMARLPQEERELLFLRYVNEISIASICRITGISRFAVYRRLSKAVKHLKDELRKEGFSE